VDRRSGPEEFVDLEIGEKEKIAHESSEVQSHKGSWPMIISHGHIKEESYHRELALLVLNLGSTKERAHECHTTCAKKGKDM
jgi:hypothetical protein